MKARLGVFILFASLGLLPAPLMAQLGSLDMTDTQAHRVIAGKVLTLQGDPVLNAAVEVYPTVPIRVFYTDSRGEFQADFQFAHQQEVTDFTVTLRVTKRGFQDAHKLMVLGGHSMMQTVAVVLRPPQEDPALLSRADLIQGVGSKLKQIGTADGLSAKEEKDYARGVQEFFDRNRADQAVPLFSKAAKGSPSCLRCRTMLAMAELSWGDWDDAYTGLGESVNAIIKDTNLGRPEPLLAYGTLLSWQHLPAKSSAYFLEGLKYAPHDALTLQELGRAQCLDLDWEVANETLKRAVADGAGPEARLLHTEALLWVGTAQEARDELNRYLDGRDIKKMPLRVRALSDRIEEKKKDAAAFVAATAKLKARGEEPLDYINHPPKNLADFEPATDQSPLEAILSSVGHNIGELFKNLPNTSSIERIHQERLNHKGKVGAILNQKFHYLCLMPALPSGPSVDEYRADSRGNIAVEQGLKENFMLTSGFVAAPLIFHAAYQQGSTFKYLGREKIKGSSTYVIAFAQKPAKSRLYGSFTAGNAYKHVYIQGLAWVDAGSYQIVRLTTDLLTPLPQVQLDKQTTEIEFSEVQFNSVNQKFWLPGEVTVTMDWGGQTFRNKHSYSDFLIFNVDQREKIAAPAKSAASLSQNLPH